MLNKLIAETYDRFKLVVQEGRGDAYEENRKHKRDGRKLAADWRDYADGRILSGKEAHDLGFVDALGNFDDAVEQAAEIAGVEKYDLVEYRLHLDLADLFRLFGKSDAKGVKLDLGVELPKLLPGRLYFLPPTGLY
jgi:protease-4